jgi:hypothetical protein
LICFANNGYRHTAINTNIFNFLFYSQGLLKPPLHWLIRKQRHFKRMRMQLSNTILKGRLILSPEYRIVYLDLFSLYQKFVIAQRHS